MPTYIPGTAGDDIFNSARGASGVLDYSGTTQGVVVDLTAADRATTVTYNSGKTLGAVLTAKGYAATTAVGHAYGAEIGSDLLMGQDTVFGGAGNDLLSGNVNANLIIGGAGNDMLVGAGGADILLGGDGNDAFVYFNPTELTAGELLDGGAGIDTLRLFDVTNSGAVSSLNSISFSGIEILASNAHVRLTAAQLSQFETVNHVTELTVTAGGAVTMGAGAHFIDTLNLGDSGRLLDATAAFGLYGTINGGAGNDTILAGEGDHVIEAGMGDDIIVVGSGINQVQGGAGNDRITVTGYNDADLTGGTGRDTLIGSDDGFDTFWVNGGTDVQAGEVYDGGARTGASITASTAETLDFSGATLRNIFSLSTWGDVRLTAAQLNGVSMTEVGRVVLADNGAVATTGMILAEAIVLADGGQRIDLTAAEAAPGEIIGGSGSDVILAGAAATVRAGLGNDRIESGGTSQAMFGDGGNDTLAGNLGGGSLDGGTGTDTLDYSTFTADLSLTVSLTAGTVSSVVGGSDIIANVENVLGGQGSDTIAGSAANNRLTGNDGADTLSGLAGLDTLLGGRGADSLDGGDGNDRLFGGAARDVLRGGAGADMFVLQALSESTATAAGRDQIVDFVRGSDRIDLAALDAISAAAGGGSTANEAFSYIGSAAFSGVAGQLHIVRGGGLTVVEGDSNGDRIADFQLELAGSHALAAADFVL